MNVDRKKNIEAEKGTPKGTEIYMSAEDNKLCYKERTLVDDKRCILNDKDAKKLKCFSIAMSIVL